VTTDRTRELREMLAALEDTDESLEAFNARWGTTATSIQEARDEARHLFQEMRVGSAEAQAAWGSTLTHLARGMDDIRTSGDLMLEAQEEVGREVRGIYTRMTGFIGGNFIESLHNFGQVSDGYVATTGRALTTLYEDFYKGTIGEAGPARLFFGKPEQFFNYIDQIVYAAGSGFAMMEGFARQAEQTGVSLEEQMKSSVMIAYGLGLSEKQMLDVLDRQFSRTGESGDAILREMTTYSHAVAAVTGDSVKAISQGMAEMISDTSTFGNITVETAAQTTAALRTLGLEVSDLAGMVDKFLNFDTAAESLSNLTTVFGVQLDAMEMMEAASNDPFEAMMMMREAFLDTGIAASDLSLQQKNLIQNQLGLRDIEAVERLFDPREDIQSMEDLQRATEGVSVTDAAESMALLEDDISRVVETGRGFSEEIMNTLLQQGLVPMASQAAQNSARMNQLSLNIDLVRENYRDLISEDLAGDVESMLDEGLTNARAGIQTLATEFTGNIARDAGVNITDAVAPDYARGMANRMTRSIREDPDTRAAFSSTGTEMLEALLEDFAAEEGGRFIGYNMGIGIDGGLHEALGWYSPVPVFEALKDDALESLGKVPRSLRRQLRDSANEINIASRTHLDVLINDTDSALNTSLNAVDRYLQRAGQSFSELTDAQRADITALALHKREVTAADIAYMEEAYSLRGGGTSIVEAGREYLETTLGAFTPGQLLSQEGKDTLREHLSGYGITVTDSEIDNLFSADEATKAAAQGAILERMAQESMRARTEAAAEAIQGLTETGEGAAGTEALPAELGRLQAAIAQLASATRGSQDRPIRITFDSQGMFGALLEEFIRGAAVTETADGWQLVTRAPGPARQ